MHFPAFEERHAAHIRPEMLALSKREAPVTLAEWKALRMNSYESHIIAPRLDDEAFAYYAAEVLRNSLPWDNSTPFITYNDALIGFVAPEMLRRWRATSAPVPLPLTNDDAPYTDAEIADLVLWANDIDSGWTAESMRAALAWQRHTARAAAALMRRAEARGRAAYAGTLPITRAEAELFRDALHHLPGFVDDHEMSGAVLRKIRAFLNGVKS